MKWSPLPADPLKFNPYQSAFWQACKARICTQCGLAFEVEGADDTCRSCKVKGLRKFHRLVLIAGRRGGKTKAASIAAVQEACIPNSIVWCCAPTNPKLMRYVLPALEQLIPLDWVKAWSSEFLDLRLKNGSLIHLQTLENPDQGRGQGLDAVWIDEASELSEEHWLVLRPSLTERRGVAILSTSPRGFDWVHSEFYAKAEEGVPGYWGTRYATSENPIISLEEIADAKATMPATMFQQEFEADFVVFEGAVYGSHLDPQILRTPDQIAAIIPEWPEIASWRQVLVGLDTGADHPFGAVKLISTEKGLVVVGEYLERHRSFVEHASSIRMLANNPGTRYAINRNERQPMIELAQHHIYCQPVENDVIAGTERVKSWLHQRNLWFIESLCPMTIKQCKSYRWASDKAKDGSVRQEKVYKKEDELPDCLRYAVMGWPQLPTTKPVSPARDLSSLPSDMRASIERMRRVDGTPKVSEETLTQDFWS